MKPVRTAVTDIVYRGPTSEIGDLWCHRQEPGVILSVWEPSPEEREILVNGGNVVLWIHSEPIPPVALEASNDDYALKVEEHPFKVIPELNDSERQ